MNFVELFLEYTKDAESPTSYFRWAAYTTLAGTLRNNVWIDLVIQKVYPNMYTLILSRRSSLVKKSTPLRTSLRLLEDIKNTKTIVGRATIAGLINALTSPSTDIDGKPIQGASAIIYSEELSSMLIEDNYATDTLTDWYDGHTNWTSNLGPGATTIKDLCMSMLASSNEELIRTVFDSRATQGGLLARTMLVVESKKRHKNSLMFVEPKGNTDSVLITHLRKVASMKGEMNIELAGKKYYDEWYNSFEPLEENSSKTGIEGRIHIHALKLAMIKSVAERYDRVITRQHIEDSINECLDLLPNYALFAGGSAGPLEKLGREIIMLMLESNNYSVKKKELWWRFYTHGNTTINNILEALVEAGNLRAFTNVDDSELYYGLTVEFLERYKNAKKSGKQA